MSLPNIDQDYFVDFLVKLLNIHSPTGFAEPAIAFVEKELSQFSPLQLSRTRKGALVAKWEVESDLPAVALTAHVDTLGAVVKEIKKNGRLKLSRIGGIQWPTVETEGVWIFTAKGEKIRGSVLIDNASGHIFGQAGTDTPRNDEHMEVRLDARTTSEKETRALGINIGDCVAFDPRVEVTNGFVRSRFLDDKACVAMAVVGRGQQSDEFNATLCIKDSGGVYHEGLNKKMRMLAEQHGIPYKTDVYPFYGSDGEAFWRAGGDVSLALIGPGIDASHNYERAHMDGLNATTNWIMAYLLSN